MMVHRSLHPQKGVTLIISLIVLVAMMLAGIALVRSVDTGNVVAGNLAFKQGTIAAGDAGTEEAIKWLKSVGDSGDLHDNHVDKGYYANSHDGLDLTGSSNNPNPALVDWDGNGCAGSTPSVCFKPAPSISVGAGTTVTYIIHRLCSINGSSNDPANSCATYLSSSSVSSKKGEIKYGEDKRFQTKPFEYYRITSRIKGPRDTISFVQAIVHFKGEE